MKYVGPEVKLPISAVIPVRNGMLFLPDFLSSNSGQFSKVDEVIFVNDNSSDETLDFLQEIATSKDNYVVLDNPNPGLVSALNMGINHSRNAWLARFDVDDSYAQSRIETQLELIDDHLGAIFSDYEILDENDNSLGIISSPVTSLFTELSLVNSRRTPHPSALLNKEAVQKVGGYLESEHPAEDLGLWLRLAQGGYNLGSTPSVLLKYRVHANSVTSKKQEEMNRVRAELVFNHDFTNTFKVAVSDLHDEIKKLRSTPYFHQRTFLSGMDLLSVRRLMRAQGVKNIPRLSIRSCSFFFSHKVLFSGLRYFFEAKKRRNNRIS